MNKVFRGLGVWLLLLVIIVTVITLFSGGDKQNGALTPAGLQEQINAKNVKDLVFYHSADRDWAEGSFIAPVADVKGTDFAVELNSPLSEKLFDLAQEKGLAPRISQPKPNTFSSLLSVGSILVPIILIVALFFFIMQQTQGSGNRVMQFGKSRARLHTDTAKRVTFEDVAGIDEVKEELVEIVDFLKHPKRYVELGARIPKGVLLYGAPGTGKTLLAKAVAGEAGVPFFSISGSDFVEMFVGVGASRVRDLFEQAKKNAPCIVFIDEIDAVGRQRGAGYGGGHDEREQTLNQLLVEMDGFGVNEGVIIIAATNRPDVLDPALLRPGRFDRQIIIDNPDINGRKAIFRVHAKGKPLDPSVDLDTMAKRTPGFTGADIQNLMNEAALLAARKRKRKIDNEDLDEAVDRVLGGGPAKKSRVITEKEKRVVAWHEAGHAVTGHLLPGAETLHKVTIVPRGRAGGYTLFLPDEDKMLASKPELMDKMVMALGGRAAEELVFGEITSGASNDIERVTTMARRMVTEWGMSEKLGPLTFGTKEGEVFLGRDIARARNYSEEIASAIDQEIRDLVQTAHQRALDLLLKHRKALDYLAETLLQKETLDGEELRQMLDHAINGEVMPA